MTRSGGTRSRGPGGGPDGLPHEVAAAWVERWDRQQEHYADRRDERFAVVADVVRATAQGVPVPVVVDLGAGPGSLAALLAERVPGACVLAVDCDPVLLALGRSWCGDRVQFVDRLIGAPGWSAGLPAPVDAVVSSTVLHYFAPDLLQTVYGDAFALLRPGGVVVNADDFASADQRSSAATIGQPDAWQEWWQEAAAAPELADAFAARSARPAVGGDNGLSVEDHVRLLTRAGFSDPAAVWRATDSAVLAARRPF